MCPPIPTGLGFVTQTTLSVDDTAGIIARAAGALSRPALRRPPNSICYATTNRQEAVKETAPAAISS